MTLKLAGWSGEAVLLLRAHVAAPSMADETQQIAIQPSAMADPTWCQQHQNLAFDDHSN